MNFDEYKQHFDKQTEVLVLCSSTVKEPVSSAI